MGGGYVYRKWEKMPGGGFKQTNEVSRNWPFKAESVVYADFYFEGKPRRVWLDSVEATVGWQNEGYESVNSERFDGCTFVLADKSTQEVGVTNGDTELESEKESDEQRMVNRR